MMGEILYFAHRHFRLIFIIAAVAVIASAAVGLFTGQSF